MNQLLIFHHSAQLEGKPDFEQWSPESKTIILSAWEQVKTKKTEKGKLYNSNEWAKIEERENERRQYKKDMNASTLPPNAVELTKYIPKPFSYFHRQKVKKSEAAAEKTVKKPRSDVVSVHPIDNKREYRKNKKELKRLARRQRQRRIEAINGACAMIGLTTGLVVEGQTGKSILSQLAGYLKGIFSFFSR
ncbi:hypothetical protein KSP40_PGU005984 [Platanthera guangdongensis]|uniref:Uncharacterized protein n=1 Tax=Platanthera guangdongensis TaxID=2320717 RepID=A0ABR2LW56_9ASPA